MSPSAEMCLLVGLLAVRKGFVTPDRLVQALEIWRQQRTRSLLGLFLERGWMSPQVGIELKAEAEGLFDSTRDPPAGSTTDPAPGPSAPAPIRYRSIEVHRVGGIGTVFKARDEELGREVALKRLQEQFEGLGAYRARFVREAEVTGRLEHPGIVPVYGLGADGDGRPFYAMRFVDGENLKEVVQRFHQAERADRDPAERAVAFRDLLTRFAAVCQTIAFAHSRGVIHRDLKPLNIMVGPFGETLVVDWGSAAVRGEVEIQSGDPHATAVANPYQVSSPGSGTPAYMAPEQFERRSDEIDTLTDVYGLGGILFEILTGSAPHVPVRQWGSISARARKTDSPPVPDALDQICARALQPDRAARHSSPVELAADIVRWLADEPVEAFRGLLVELARRIEADPTRELREERARTLTVIGLVYFGMARHADAQRTFVAVVDAYEALLATWPDEVRFRADLAKARLYLAEALRGQGRGAEAEAAQKAAVAEYGQLLASHPRDYRTNFATMIVPPDVARAALEGVIPPIDSDKLDDYPLAERSSATGTMLPGFDDQQEQLDLIRAALPQASFSNFRLLARGGASEIFVACDNVLGREVVIKQVRLDFSRGLQTARFLREAHISATLRHPNVVTVYSFGATESHVNPFLVLKYYRDGTLQEAIGTLYDRPARPTFEAPEFRRCLGTLVQVCDALEFAHRRGIVHRDPKPSNVFLGIDGEVVLGDWGLATWWDVEAREAAETRPDGTEWPSGLDPTADLTATGSVMGTPVYMSPEAAAGERPTPRSDIFSIGACLFELLTGQKYRSGADRGTIVRMASGFHQRPQAVRPDVPRELDAICARATALTPADRHPTAADLAHELRRWLDGARPSVWRRLFQAISAK